MLFTIILFATAIGVQAQESVAAAGGEASGSGGTLSYTVGQTAYTTNTGSNGNSLSEGVQQAFEISIISEIPEEKETETDISVYPNPANTFLIIKADMSQSGTGNLTYEVFDAGGKLLQSVKAGGTETKIETKNLTPGVYLIKIKRSNEETKVFKIIKTR